MTSLKFALSAAVCISLSACGAGSVTEEASLATDGDELSQTAQLLGSYKAIDGTLLGLVLAKQDGKKVFVADQQVWCFKAPCYPVHMSGTWSIRLGKIYLTEGDEKTVYAYAIGTGTLTLSDRTTGDHVGTLEKVDTWCGQTADCGLQTWSHPKCLGGAVCSVDQRCTWSCGSAPFPGGYGDDCAEQTCDLGLTCQDGARCAPAQACDPSVEKSCGDALVCTIAPNDAAICQPFAHATLVGRGYKCGGSIGVSCARGLTCQISSATKGAVGTCQ